MKIVNEFPPNFEFIKALNPPKTAVFPYGDTIFNPYNQVIYPDIEEHEKVHQRQQGDDPDIWWRRYITDSKFRLNQEVEAYAHQYRYWKKIRATNKELKNILHDLTTLLTNDYQLNITYQQVENLIRRKHG